MNHPTIIPLFGILLGDRFIRPTTDCLKGWEYCGMDKFLLKNRDIAAAFIPPMTELGNETPEVVAVSLVIHAPAKQPEPQHNKYAPIPFFTCEACCHRRPAELVYKVDRKNWTGSVSPFCEDDEVLIVCGECMVAHPLKATEPSA